MAVDVKQQLELIAMQELVEGVSGIRDIVDVLSEEKIVSTQKLTVNRFTDKDGNVVTTADKYGAMASTYIANYEDRTYVKDEYRFPQSDGIAFVIPRDALQLFNISKEMVNGSGTKVANNVMMSIGNALAPELRKLISDMKDARRAQVRYLLSTLDAPTLDWQKPLGLNPVDEASNRTTGQWAYDNKLDAALTVAEFKLAVNILQGKQKNVRNSDYMTSKPVMLLHNSDFSLAESIMLPNLSVNTLHRTAGDSILPERLSVKACDVYNGSDNTDNWILLGMNHKIYRMAFVTPLGEATNGLSVDVEWIPATLANVGKKEAGLRITLYDRSIMVCDSAIDIVKAVVPEA